MNGLDFLRLVLPPRGWYVGFAQKPDCPAPQQYAFKTLEGLLAWLGRLDRGGWTTYFACASFREFQVWDAAQQKNVRRTHKNVLVIVNLWMDVDTKESHATAKYADRQEAAEAVLAFCRHVGLPPPVWVSSGGGLHVHWPLAVELELAEWQIYSRGLRAAAEHFGLAIDARKTLDGSAVLRVPGSHNLKFKPPRLVQAGEAVPRYPLDRFEKLKELGLVEPNKPRSLPVIGRSDSPIATAILGTLDSDPSDPFRATRACAQLGKFVSEPGAFSEPFHRGVAGHCKISSPDGKRTYLGWLAPDWRAEGEKKFDGWRVDNPPTCGYFKENSPFPELCNTCPWYGKITAPIELGRLAEKKIERLAQARGAPIHLPSGPPHSEALASVGENELNGFPILKPPWDLQQGKIVHVHEGNKKDDEDVVRIVADHPIYVAGEHFSEALGNVFCTLKHKPPNEPWCTISVPAGHLSGNAAKGLAQIADGGAHIRNHALFLEYVRDQIAEWKLKNRWGMRYEQCGWKPQGFLSGSRLYTPTDVQIVPVSDEVAIREKLGLGPQPGADVREFLAALNKGFPPDHYCAQLNLAFSYGTVLHQLLNQYQGSLVVVNMSSQSQTGKSVILYACAAIWGLWDALSLKDQDTAPSLGLILAALKNLPGFVDEIQHFARDQVHGVQKLLTFLDLFTSGIDKHRALPFGVGVRVQTSRWLTFLITSSNTSIIDLVQALGKAGSSDEARTNRYIELDALPPRDFDQTAGPELERHLFRHAGAAGDAFLKFVVRDEVQKYAAERLQLVAKELWKRVGYVKEQRFRVNGLAVAQVAGELLKERGMPLTCRLDEMIDWGIGQIRAGTPIIDAAEAIDSLALQALDKFLRHNANNTVRVQRAYKKNTVQPLLDNRMPNKPVIRSEADTDRVYLVDQEFKHYCVEHGYFWKNIERSLTEQKLLLGKHKMSIGAGTGLLSAQVTCCEFDGRHPLFANALQPNER